MRRKVLHPYTRLPTYALRFPPCPPALSLHAAVAYCLSGRAGSPPLGGQCSFCFSAGDGAPAALSTGSSPRLCCAPARAVRGEQSSRVGRDASGMCISFFFLLDLGWSQDRLLAGAHRADPADPDCLGRGLPNCPRKKANFRLGRLPSAGSPSRPRAPRARLAPARGCRGEFFTRFRAPWREVRDD